MINLLWGEFYKLRKSKCIYICCIAAVAFVLLMYGSLVLVDKIQNENLANGTMGVIVTEDGMSSQRESGGNIFDEVGILDVLQQIFGTCFSAIVASVFICIFVLGEYGNGAIKNVVGKGYSRGKIFLAKYIMVNTAVIGMMLFISAVTVLLGILFIGTDGIDGEFLYNFCIYTGIQILLEMGLNGIIIVISECTRNVGAGFSISICMIIFSSLITGGLDLLLFKINVRISDYWIKDLIGNCPVSGFDSSYVIRTVIISLIWAAGCFVIGSMHFKKADV